MNPGCDRYWDALGLSAARDRRDLPLAREAFETAVSLTPDSVEAWRSLVRVLVELGQIDAALKAARRAARVAPDDPVAQFNLGLVHRELGRPDTAIPQLRKALRLGAEPKFRLALAQALLDDGRVAAALRLLTGLGGTDYAEPARILRVDALGGLDRATEAMQLAQEGVRECPSSALAWVALARAQWSVGARDDARRSVRRAGRLSPADPWVQWAAGEMGIAFVRRRRTAQVSSCRGPQVAVNPSPCRTCRHVMRQRVERWCWWGRARLRGTDRWERHGGQAPVMGRSMMATRRRMGDVGFVLRLRS